MVHGIVALTVASMPESMLMQSVGFVPYDARYTNTRVVDNMMITGRPPIPANSEVPGETVEMS